MANKRYKLEPVPIGRGGMGEVFKAIHRRTGDAVAFKRCTSIAPEATARMAREIQIQTTIAHVNVMPVLDYDVNFRWFTMPLALHDLTLGSYPSKQHDNPGMDPELLAVVLREVAAGLHAAHERGFIHRDMKPSNILRLSVPNNPPRWVVADWGLARGARGATTKPWTHTGHLLGTLLFAAPELANDAHAATPAADFYSLGKTAYWALTANNLLPFRPPPRIDGPWADFIDLCTRDDPIERPQHVEEFLSLLNQACPPRRPLQDYRPFPVGYDSDEFCFRCGAEIGRFIRCPNCGLPTNDY